MIVKDESHIIERTLHMLCSKIRFDYWVICDTGSSDNTREIILQFFKEKNIPGELHCDDWVDFGHNRSLALERAFNKTDLLLVFDADDEIHGTIHLPSVVLFDEYHLKFGVPKSGMNYTRTQIINNHKRFKYLSVLHEFISCQEPEPARVCVLDGDYFLISGRTGSRNKDPNKYLKDATILATAHAHAVAKGDDLHKRYAFYCANSYRDCGRFEDAIKWYKITLSQNNWNQEKYVSCIYIYQCYEALKQVENGFFYLVKAFSYDNERVECLYPLIVHYCCENMNEVAYNYFKMVKMTSAQEGKLFVETDKAGFYVPYYMIIVADRVGDRECGIRMYEHIFKEKHRTFSAWHLRNLFFNLRFFINHVKTEGLEAFVAMANGYIKFVIDNGVPTNTFDELTLQLIPPQQPTDVSMMQKIKAKSTFKESRNILFYTGYCNGDWNYSHMKSGALGGSEKAVAYLSKELGVILGKERGMTIYVAGNVMPEKLEEFNVVYVSLDELPNLLSKLNFHTVICSRYISFLEIYGHTCSFYQFYIWAHDTCLLSYGCNLADAAVIEKWAECIDGCICQTQWHADRFKTLYPRLAHKMQTINNGIDVQLFPAIKLKQSEKFIYTSRTERGLARILDLWPEVIGVLPHATLSVSTYEAFPCNDEERHIQARIESLNRAFPNNPIEHLGKLNASRLYSEMSTAEYWLYPTNWPETSCITAMEMMMSEVVCLYHPLAGLTDTMNGHGVKLVPGSEISMLREISNDEEKKEVLRKEGHAYAESCSWTQRAHKWVQTLMGKRVAIFNSFPFHYELFGHILSYFTRNGEASSVTIFTETKNNMGWLDFYKKQFREINIQYKSIADYCDARNEFDLTFVPTDDDFAFKHEWINDKCIVTDNHVSVRRPEYKHHIGMRPFAGSDKRWALPCCDLASVAEKKANLHPEEIHVGISVGWKIVLNYDAINRLRVNPGETKLHLHFVGRKFEDIVSKINIVADIHLYEKMETCEMIDLLKKCDYIMTDLQNDDHINGISMSGIVPLSFSTLTPLIISKQNNRIYGFKNVVEFELDSNEPIVLTKKAGNWIEQLNFERDELVAMYDGAIKDITCTKIVDCFIFYNEIDMLAYRLHALNSVVDYFVIVEAHQTFVGANKPLHFGENMHDPRFAKYVDKIIHIVVDLPHKGKIDISQNQQWTNEKFQRNCISRGIDKIASKLNDHDIIVVADVDEIPDPNTLAKMKKECSFRNQIMAFEQDLYYYSLKFKNIEKWPLCKAITFKKYQDVVANNITLEDIRQLKCEKIERGGWHMSYFGDAKFIKNKLENFSHQEYNNDTFINLEEIQKRIETGTDLYMRPWESFQCIPISENDYLPPDYQLFLASFL
jgi:beta-1,4-mannosyl-glycoprotein beta-1,4-N-acetylglucosaminyltransferase